jgi:hypothetical protein
MRALLVLSIALALPACGGDDTAVPLPDGGDASVIVTTDGSVAPDGASDAASDAPHVNDPACPAAFDARPLGTACPVASGSLTCDYAEGRCACVPCNGDAGPSFEWGCRPWDGVVSVGPFSPDASGFCPAPVPNVGDPCGPYPDDTVCPYDVCPGVVLGPSLVCTNRTWQLLGAPPTCTAHAC